MKTKTTYLAALALLVAICVIVPATAAASAPPASATTEMVVSGPTVEMNVDPVSTGALSQPEALTDTAPEPAPAPAPEPEPAPAPAPAPEPQPAPAPASVEPPPPAPSEPPAPVEPAPSTGGTATAVNRSRTVQVLVQVQRGCRSNCHATSQTQVAEQIARTFQQAEADAPAGNADASNESETEQFVWQAQLGCVAFCYATSQTQVASQVAETTQSASATGADATAGNVSSTGQFVWQYQRGCSYECYAAVQTQASAQASTTTQDAQAAADEDAADLEELRLAFSGIEAWAANLNATVQLSFQFQDGDCRRDCHGGSQTQYGSQEAVTVQSAVAGANTEEARTQME